jgi:hypothetical protein
MDKTTLRPLIFAALRRTPQTHVHAIESEIRQKTTGYERGDALLVQEVVWELLLGGILAPGKNSLNLHLPFIHVTEFGQKCLDAGAEAAYDPEGYVARLRSETRDQISANVLDSAHDAVLAFDRGLFRTSVVLLSRAAIELLDEVQHALGLPNSADPAVSSDDGGSRRAPSHRRTIAEPPASSPEGREQDLAELETLARLAHSATRSPRLPPADRESALGRLLLFPSQCRLAYTLMAGRHDPRQKRET